MQAQSNRPIADVVQRAEYQPKRPIVLRVKLATVESADRADIALNVMASGNVRQLPDQVLPGCKKLLLDALLEATKANSSRFLKGRNCHYYLRRWTHKVYYLFELAIGKVPLSYYIPVFHPTFMPEHSFEFAQHHPKTP